MVLATAPQFIHYFVGHISILLGLQLLFLIVTYPKPFYVDVNNSYCDFKIPDDVLQMWQVAAVRLLRVYAPYITLPFAAVVGYIGYNMENFVSDKYTPFNESIKESRNKRLITDEKLETAGIVEMAKYSNVLSSNVSPSLQK